MTRENEDEEIELTPAEDNHWYWLMQTTIGLDKGQTPNGWHWFVALHGLLNFDFKAEQARLPDSHPLKSESLKLNTTKVRIKDIIIEFKEDLKLANIDIISIINFSALDFLEETDFSNFIFPLPVSFGHSKFHKSVNFTLASFYLPAVFSDVVFSDNVRFNKTTFYSELAFQNTNFFKEAYFIEAKFLGGAVFNDATFSDVSGCAHFSKAIFSSAIFFNNTKFYGKAFFYSVKFSSYTTFENTIFKIYVPRFYGAELNDEIFWTDIKLPKFKKADDETKEKYKKRIKDNENAYENLSTKLGNQKKYRDEYFFFRQELSCQQELAESRTSGIAFWLYGIFSDYGYRIGRAVWWWAGHIVFWVFVIATIATIYGDMQFHKNLPCAISVSFANANPYAFFGFDSVQLTGCYDMFNKHAPILFAIIKVIQTILGIALLFLVGLTLRVRFRLK